MSLALIWGGGEDRALTEQKMMLKRRRCPSSLVTVSQKEAGCSKCPRGS